MFHQDRARVELWKHSQSTCLKKEREKKECLSGLLDLVSVCVCEGVCV